METNYPKLRRPKRKLCYLTKKKSPPRWTAPLALEDIDQMFDDMDSASHGSVDLLSPSPLLQTFDIETSQCVRDAPAVPQKGHVTEQLPKCHVDPKGDALHPATRSTSPKQDVEFDSPFKAHMPVKTSSPFEENVVVEERDNEKDQVASTFLFARENQEKEKAKTKAVILQKPQCNGHITEENDDCEFESPPKMFVISKPSMSSHKNKVEGSRQAKADPPVSAVQREPELTAPKKITENVEASVEPTCVRKRDMTTFLKRLREAVQPTPAISRTPRPPVKAPTPPPEPEDDFLILEDDEPLWISIPSKTTSRKNQRQSRTSSTDKDSSTDKGTKDNPPETAEKQQEESEPTKSKPETAEKQEESEQMKSKLGSQTLSQKLKKMRRKEKTEVTEPGNKDELSSPEDLPVIDVMEEEKPEKKKRQLKKVPSKESDKEEKQPKDGASGEEEPTLKTEKKAQRSLKVVNTKTSRATSVKGDRKVTQGSVAVTQTVDVEAGKEQSPSSEEHADAEDLGSPSDKEIKTSEVQTEKDLAEEKVKHIKLEVGSKRSSSEDDQILGKRKRRQTGEWWLDHRITEVTKVTDKQTTPEKSKQDNQKPSAAAAPAPPAAPSPSPSPVKVKKERVLKKRNRTRLAPSPSQNTNITKEKKTRQKKNRNTGKDTQPEEVFHMPEAEKLEEQEVLDQEVDVQSPLVLSHRALGFNSGEQVFQRVYHHTPNKNQSVTPAPVSPRGPREQLGAEKRRRKPPGNWWAVDDVRENVESVSSQPQPQPQQQQQQQPKPRKERKKQSRSPRLGTPKNDNRPISSKTDGGILSMEAGEPTQSSPPNPEIPQERKSQSEDRLNPLRSGPSSMIWLEEYEEDEDLVLNPPRVLAVLSTTDLCSPPLSPLLLQTKDKANLTEWFRNLWSRPDEEGAEITPDQFDWYSYRGRAIGFQVDLNGGFFCHGKILLGSYSKKPLWVDHGTTTVFNLLTSSVSVTIDCKESRFHPGQSFMVPCGHAYSLQNVTAQPAVLSFTRMVEQSSN